MRIKKILNTNAIIGEDVFGHEVLLLGSGVGFRRKPGDIVDKKLVEKNFILTDPKQMNRFEQIMGSIPPDYILITEKIIDYALNFHHMELNEAIHVSLVDHLYNAVCNLEDGVSIPNNLLSDIARFYPDEYDVMPCFWSTRSSVMSCRMTKPDSLPCTLSQRSRRKPI